MLASCASGEGAPITYGRGEARAETRETARAPERSPERAPQRAADWADGPSLADHALRPEEAHPFDPARTPQTHRVRAGETLYDIASAYQVPLRALIDQNELEPPYAVAEGRTLRLPPPRFHTVARGETFEDIARRYNIDPRSLGLLNRMAAPYSVRAGERVLLPAMARAAAPQQETAPPPATPNPNARFAWPISGEIAARFGPQAGGQHLDGIEIAGTVGESVKAAGEGQVVFAGESVPNHGVIIIIAHAENYVTTYAHNRRALVREGQRVRAGETIGELGQRPGQPARLLFQVRQGGAVVDPAPLLGRR
ncbi:MAG TPA: M23 family metallopeptidase [Terricaulis sp.]|nr:M23 family metallopeptidase [Terricaulis sp.]